MALTTSRAIPMESWKYCTATSHDQFWHTATAAHVVQAPRRVTQINSLWDNLRTLYMGSNNATG
jgi:hypothetical protein